MPIPLLIEKLRRPSLTRADQGAEYLRKLWSGDKAPRCYIFVYSRSLLKAWAVENKIVPHTVSSMMFARRPESPVALVCGMGFGAPALVARAEEFIAAGAKELLIVGLAGSLQQNLTAGEVVVCERALRDEGCSYHYLPASRYAEPDQELSRRVKDRLIRAGMNVRTGPSWTTDAIYRETAEEIKTYANEGILTVEMEASALFAVGQYHQVKTAAAFVISDVLSEKGWQMEFDNPRKTASMRQIIQAMARDDW